MVFGDHRRNDKKKHRQSRNWTCTSCKTLTFYQKSQCFKCKKPRDFAVAKPSPGHLCTTYHTIQHMLETFNIGHLEKQISEMGVTLSNFSTKFDSMMLTFGSTLKLGPRIKLEHLKALEDAGLLRQQQN